MQPRSEYPSRIVVMSESAGKGLAMILALTTRDRGARRNTPIGTPIFSAARLAHQRARMPYINCAARARKFMQDPREEQLRLGSPARRLRATRPPHGVVLLPLAEDLSPDSLRLHRHRRARPVPRRGHNHARRCDRLRRVDHLHVYPGAIHAHRRGAPDRCPGVTAADFTPRPGAAPRRAGRARADLPGRRRSIHLQAMARVTAVPPIDRDQAACPAAPTARGPRRRSGRSQHDHVRRARISARAWLRARPLFMADHHPDMRSDALPCGKSTSPLNAQRPMEGRFRCSRRPAHSRFSGMRRGVVVGVIAGIQRGDAAFLHNPARVRRTGFRRERGRLQLL